MGGFRLLVAGVFVGSIGCSGGGETDIGGMHFTTLQPAPAMMQTAVDPAVHPSVLIAIQQPDSLDLGLQLFDGGNHSVTGAIAEQPSSPADAAQRGALERFTFTPASPLPVGWYTLRFRPLGRAQAIGTIVADEKNGMVESHFHVGSRPTVIAIEACGGASGAQKFDVSLTISEPVLVADSPPVVVASAGVPLSCTPRASWSNLVYQYVPLDCTQPPSDDLSVTVSDGMVTAAGVGVQNAAGATHFAIAVPTTVENGCRVWRETVHAP